MSELTNTIRADHELAEMFRDFAAKLEEGARTRGLPGLEIEITQAMERDKECAQLARKAVTNGTVIIEQHDDVAVMRLNPEQFGEI